MQHHVNKGLQHICMYMFKVLGSIFKICMHAHERIIAYTHAYD